MEAEKLKALIKASQQTKKLDLSYGGLDEVPPEVAKLRHLEILDLSNNNITDLPEEMFKSKTQRKFNNYYFGFSI
jgi:Leucine-rich repeat (LRR) protein